MEVLGTETLYETTHSWNSEPQNIEQEISNDEVWNRCAQSFFKNNNDRIPYFDIRYSLFDTYSPPLEDSIFAFSKFHLPIKLVAGGCSDPAPAEHLNIWLHLLAAVRPYND